YAASNGHVEVVKLLLEKKANLNVAPANRSRFAPLHLAVSGGHTEVLQLLLESGADPNAADKYGLSPLILAAIKGKESIVQLLLAQHNVDPQSSDLRGRTALSWASIKGHEAVIELLLADERVIRDSRGHVDYTPLMRAVRKSEYSVVRGFIQRGYPADERDRDSLLLQVAILMPLEAFEEIAVAMGFDSEDFTLGLEGLFHEEE
ncbi:ankyrin repeat-containing domain protein, partial [Xylaria nigripes]